MPWHDKSLKNVINELNTDEERGLSEKEAGERLRRYGKNEIKEKVGDGFFKKFFDQFKDFMIVVLLIAAAVSFVTSFMNGEADAVEPIIILCIVVFNALIGVIQENRAEKSIEALKKIAAPSSTVLREGKVKTISAHMLVPGDIVILKSGDKISADCRIIECSDASADESMLSGESAPVEKSGSSKCDLHAPLAERENMLWSGSMLLSGKCKAVVCSTGDNTELGGIATMIMSAETGETPLKAKLSEIGKRLGAAALVICAAVFVIGIYKSIPPFEMFMTAISLAVAAIPEGLPAIVTIMLAIGVGRMAKKGAIVRNLPSVETLGCANVICTDKTGTLTENRMSVSKVFTGDKKMLFENASACSDPESFNPTEAAILNEASRLKVNACGKKRLAERPFSSEKKYMSTLISDGKDKISITKGAPDTVVEMCSYFYDGKRAVPLTSQLKREITAENRRMAQNALRVIAVAYKDGISSNAPVERGLVFSGLIGMEDPPRKEVGSAVKLCRNAGIKTVMVTGDHPDTACAVAGEIGISGAERAISGKELDKMTQKDLEDNIENYSVFARVTPAHKVRIVKAWQKKGAIVAMTGDGVNDAPALKTADIGCGMGLSGTEVAKNASDMILTDDNFAAIVEAVREGRGIFDNIKKAIRFLLSSNIGEILTVFLGIMFGFQAPLSPIQLLWINLVTDSLPAIALGLDPSDGDIMNRPPRPSDKSVFAGGLWFTIILEGAMIGSLALLAFVIGSVRYNLTTARTMAFCVLSLSQLVHAFNARSERSLFSVGAFTNKYLVGAFATGVLLQFSAVAIEPVARIFKVYMPDAFCLWVIAALSAAPLAIVEVQKLFNRKRRKRLT